MDKQQLGLAAGAALLCAVLWIGGNDIGALGLLALALVAGVKLMTRSAD